jgi:hypothetical protein
MNRIIIFSLATLICILFYACAPNKASMIKETFCLTIPEEYHTLEYSTESSVVEGWDQELFFKLKFTTKLYANIKQQLPKIDSLKESETQYLWSRDKEMAFLEFDDDSLTLKFQLVRLNK